MKIYNFVEFKLLDASNEYYLDKIYKKSQVIK